jgi:uncharacterized protein YbaA (DUF1428 family)
MNYIDGFVTPVPLVKKEAYLKHASRTADMFKEYGALKIVESWGDDVPEGKLTSFTMAVKRADDEAVVLTWIEWPSKAFRDAAWEKIMADPRLDPANSPTPPFDGKRLIYGGFQIILEK